MGCFYQISHEVPLKVGEMVLSQSKSLTTPEIAQPSPAYADSSRGLNTQGGARGNAEAWASGMLEGGAVAFPQAIALGVAAVRREDGLAP